MAGAWETPASLPSAPHCSTPPEGLPLPARPLKAPCSMAFSSRHGKQAMRFLSLCPVPGSHSLAPNHSAPSTSPTALTLKAPDSRPNSSADLYLSFPTCEMDSNAYLSPVKWVPNCPCLPGLEPVMITCSSLFTVSTSSIGLEWGPERPRCVPCTHPAHSYLSAFSLAGTLTRNASPQFFAVFPSLTQPLCPSHI